MDAADLSRKTARGRRVGKGKCLRALVCPRPRERAPEESETSRHSKSVLTTCILVHAFYAGIETVDDTSDTYLGSIRIVLHPQGCASKSGLHLTSPRSVGFCCLPCPHVRRLQYLRRLPPADARSLPAVQEMPPARAKRRSSSQGGAEARRARRGGAGNPEAVESARS